MRLAKMYSDESRICFPEEYVEPLIIVNQGCAERRAVREDWRTLIVMIILIVMLVFTVDRAMFGLSQPLVHNWNLNLRCVEVIMNAKIINIVGILMLLQSQLQLRWLRPKTRSLARYQAVQHACRWTVRVQVQHLDGAKMIRTK